MIRALIIKELRESLPLLAAALVGAAWALLEYTGGPAWLAWGDRGSSLPFAVGDFETTALLMVAGGLAVLLALRQTAWEDLMGTYHYLLHRPVERGRMFLVKAAVGMGLVMAVGAGLILAYALWAATPGTHASPFFWWMTKPAWHVWLVLPAIYAGTFLCGVRSARWYAWLLPLVGCGAIVFVLVMQPWLWVAATGSLALVATCLPAAIEAARVRDY